MERDLIIPPELISIIGSEKPDFIVKAERANPLRKSIFLLIFGIGWTLFSSIFMAVFIGPVLMGGESTFESNGQTVTASVDNLGPLLVPGVMIGFFMFIGLSVIGAGLFLMLKKGGFFVGTPSRLICFSANNYQSTDWEQFNGNIEVRGNAQKGDVSLQLRTGKMVSQKNRPSQYVADMIYIAAIPDVYEIEKFCRQRIKENDPTPVESN